MEIEHFFICPYCWQEISFVIDLSVDGQSYIEDCEVCCRPIRATYSTDGEEITEFDAAAIDQ